MYHYFIAAAKTVSLTVAAVGISFMLTYLMICFIETLEKTNVQKEEEKST